MKIGEGIIISDTKVIKEQKVKSEPETVVENKTVQEPRTVIEQKTVELLRTVMEEKTIQEEKTVMREHVYERITAATCDQITSMKVMNPQGESLGSISDLMIDLDSGRILYAAMSIGGLFNKKMFAIPWQAFSVANKDNYYEEGRENNLTLNIPKEKFDESEGFDKENWPREPDQEWLSNTYSRYGYRGWWEEDTSNK